MLIKVISLPFNSALGGFNDEEVREFIKDKELISAQDYLVTKGDVPYLVFVLKYFPHRSELEPKPPTQAKEKQQRDDSWRENLTEAEMSLFNRLRDWRSERSKKDGLPPYILFTNQQLAAVVKKRPESSASLMQIDGIGKAKADKYGADVLAIVKVGGAEPASSEAKESKQMAILGTADKKEEVSTDGGNV